MKRMLCLLSSITLLTGVTATVFSTKITSNLTTLSSNIINNQSENQELEEPFWNFKNIDRNTVENILNDVLIQKNNDVILNYEYFYQFYEKTREEITTAKEFKIKNTTIYEVEEAFFYPVENDDGTWFVPSITVVGDKYGWLLEKIHIFASLIIDKDGIFWDWPNENN